VEGLLGVENANVKLILPNTVVSPTDVARIIREIKGLDEFFRQSEIREGGTPQNAPRYSRLLDSMVVENKLNLIQQEDRSSLIEVLEQLQNKAPVLHMSFSVDPPGPYVQKIVFWLRQHIDETILVRVGLQPNIGAGCIVRTENKSFDFSLRKFFDSKREFFIQKLHESIAPSSSEDNQPEEPVPEPEVTPSEELVEQQPNSQELSGVQQ